jgi:hypothetical protein
MITLTVLLLFQADAQTLVSVTARGEPTKVVLTFSKPADPAWDYAIDNGVKVESAVRGLDLRTVTLTTSPLAEGVTYTVKVKTLGTRTFTYRRGVFGAPVKEEPRTPRIPKFSKPVLFNTPEADAILAALQVFPKNNPWNEDISRRPVHPDSDALVASVGKDKTVHINFDMAFVLAPPGQPRVDVTIREPAESDKGPFPVPDNAPVEGWPLNGTTLEMSQREGGSDRHLIVVDPVNGMLYEFFHAFKRTSGWEADLAAMWDLKSNRMRPIKWSSADAAGLPIFAALPRFEECEAGRVDHAMRFTIRRTRRAFIYPASHQAGSSDSPTVPAMGQRFRLKASVDVSGYPRHAQAIALGLKKHGMFVADNGSDWFLSVPPDSRLKGLETLRRLNGSDFEAVTTTGETDLGR